MVMFIQKRKRSDEDEVSISSRESSSSPMSTGSITAHQIPRGVDSRTLKRWRSNKPSEQVVHEYTMQKLFAAQQQHNHPHENQPQQQHTTSPPNSIHSPHPMQTPPRSTHPFFAMFVQHQTHLLSTPAPMLQTCHSCDDCDRQLPASWDDEHGEAYVCGGMGCGKRVCETCSIGGEAVGIARRCLNCAMHMDMS